MVAMYVCCLPLLQGIPADEESLLPKLQELLIERFGATPKTAVAA